MSNSADRDRAGEGVGYQSRALTRGLAILGAFDDAHPVLTPAQLHARLDIPKPTIVRLAMILEQEGFLARADGTYRLGPRTFELGQVYVRGMHLADIVQPVLDELSEELGRPPASPRCTAARSSTSPSPARGGRSAT